jgi:hypothetical protein
VKGTLFLFSDLEIFESYVEATRLRRGHTGVDYKLASWAGFHVIAPEDARQRAARWRQENEERRAASVRTERYRKTNNALQNLRYREKRGVGLVAKTCRRCGQRGHNRRTCRASSRSEVGTS